MRTLYFLWHPNRRVHCIRQIVHCFRLKTALHLIDWKLSCVRDERSALLQTDECTASDRNRTASNGLKIIVCTRQRSALHQIDQCTASDQNRTAPNSMKIIVCTQQRSALQLPMHFYFRVHCNKGTTKILTMKYNNLKKCTSSVHRAHCFYKERFYKLSNNPWCSVTKLHPFLFFRLHVTIIHTQNTTHYTEKWKAAYNHCEE